MIPKGYDGIDHEYDDYGNNIRCTYYNADGSGATMANGSLTTWR